MSWAKENSQFLFSLSATQNTILFLSVDSKSVFHSSFSLWISLTFFFHETTCTELFIKALLPDPPNSIRNRSLWLLVQLVHLFLYVIGFHVGWTSRCHAPQHDLNYLWHGNQWQWLRQYMCTLQITTTKKRSYPSIFKTAGIAPKSIGIGSKFLSRRFFSWRF